MLANPGGLELLPHLAHRTGQHGEVVRDDPGLPAVEEAVAGHDTVRGRPLRRKRRLAAKRLLVSQHPELDEGAGIEEQVEPFANGEL